MEEYYRSAMQQHGDIVVTEINRIDTNSRSYFSSSCPAHEFNFTFTLGHDSCFSFWYTKQGSPHNPQLVKKARLPLQEDSVVLNLDRFLSQDKAQQVIAQKIEKLVVSPSLGRKMTDMALDLAWTVLRTKPSGHNSVFVHLRAIATFKFDFDEAMTRTMPVFEERMCTIFKNFTVPNAALDSLRNDCGTCGTCLKDFSNRYEPVFIPCAHGFHADCIRKWFSISGRRRCPVCGFNIPASWG